MKLRPNLQVDKLESEKIPGNDLLDILDVPEVYVTGCIRMEYRT